MTGKPQILLTGFEPFGGEPINPSQVLVQEFKDQRSDDVDVMPCILPVDLLAFPAVLDEAIEKTTPNIALLVGQATGRETICLERTAYNTAHFGEVGDNAGHNAAGEELIPEAPPQLTSPLPLDRWVEHLTSQGTSTVISDDAGRHLCNAVLFSMLHRYPDIPAVFLHLPLLPEQSERRAQGEPSLPLDASRKCLHEVIQLMAQHLGS